MKYIENPKTKGSGIICCIPQTGRCPNNCADCFFQSGRSYLEPLDTNLPNLPTAGDVSGRVVWVNDGNDSNVDRKLVIDKTSWYRDKFYNTAINANLEGFDAPVVLTVNPGEYTDQLWHRVDVPIPYNLMFVRVRTNAWNLEKVVDPAVKYYSEHGVPIVLTFMAYYGTPPVKNYPGQPVLTEDDIRKIYIFRKRTLNPYWAVTTDAWHTIMKRYEDNKWVSSCGKIEGEKGTTACRFCGVCLREYFATMERMRS